jgi:hypothetical protein
MLASRRYVAKNLAKVTNYNGRCFYTFSQSLQANAGIYHNPANSPFITNLQVIIQMQNNLCI